MGTQLTFDPEVATLDRLLTKRQAAAYLNLHIDSVTRWIKLGVLPSYQLSRNQTRIRLSDLDSFIALRAHRRTNFYFDIDNATVLPRRLVMRLTGLKYDALNLAICTGAFRDLSPEAVRDYMLNRRRLKRSELHMKRRNLLRHKLRYAQTVAKRTLCQNCRRRVTKATWAA